MGGFFSGILRVGPAPFGELRALVRRRGFGRQR